MAAPSILTLRDLTKLELPDGPPDEPKYAAWVDAAVSAALEIVHSLAPSHLTEHWSKGKVHHGAQTYTSRSTSNPPPGAGDTCGFKWHVRQSRHDASAELSYEQFERGLLRDHSTNEQKYIESCTEARQIEVLKPGELEIWQTLYHLPFPAANRDFAFVILTVPVPPGSETHAEPVPLRSFLVISIPVAHTNESGYTRGKYVSVEHVAERPDGQIEWTMAVSSDPAGMVPKLISEKSMPSKISEDVPSFIQWARKEYA